MEGLEEYVFDRQKLILQLWDIAYRWYKKFCTKKYDKNYTVTIENLNTEIYEVVHRLLTKDKDKVPRKKKKLLGFLRKCIDNKAAEFKRIEALARIPKGKMSRIKLKTVLEKREGGKLTKNELIEEFKKLLDGNISNIPKWKINELMQFKKMLEKEKKKEVDNNEVAEYAAKWFEGSGYTYINNLLQVQIGYTSGKKYGQEEVISELDHETTKSIFNEKKFNNPLEELFSKNEKPAMAKLRDAIQDILSEYPPEKRDCLKALITSYCCIDKTQDLEDLRPVLDIDMLTAYQKDGIKPPTDREIYIKFINKKKMTKGTAQTNVSNLLKDFRRKLKETNPEIFF
jgi:hypothetical protein